MADLDATKRSALAMFGVAGLLDLVAVGLLAIGLDLFDTGGGNDGAVVAAIGVFLLSGAVVAVAAIRMRAGSSG